MKYTHGKAARFSRPLNFCLISTLLLWTGCANPIPPTGGPKDSSPPKLIIEESTPNYLTNFNQREIVLTFDEWIQLKDQNLQIVISPPLNHRPEITQKGKSVIIKLHEDEILRERTTYLINFGSSIADITEGNLLDQYKYVFSTGTYIDSLGIGGSVVQAATGEPAKQTLIILHDNLSDTAITKVLPAYFAKSNDSGQWRIENVRSDTFNVFALTDLNLNYRFDQVGEKIAFLGHSVVLPDTSEMRQHLVLFEENPVLNILDVDRRSAGITKIILSGQSKALSVEPVDPSAIRPPWGVQKDTLFIWNATPDAFNVVVHDGDLVIDTVLIERTQAKAGIQNTYSPGRRFLHPAEALVIQSKIPIDTFDQMKILCFLSDSINIDNPAIQIDSTDTRLLQVRHPWREQERYRVLVLPGAITDIFGSVNDTIQFNFQISPINSFGQIFANITGLSDSMQYVVELIHPQSGVIATQSIRYQSSEKLKFDKLQPQPYQVRIIEDANGNGRWDTGNLSQQRQPERVFIQTLEPLRAGWDLEATVIWQTK